MPHTTLSLALQDTWGMLSNSTCRQTPRNTSATGGTSPRFCTRLPPPVEVGRRPPGRGGGGGGAVGGGGLAAEEGLSRDWLVARGGGGERISRGLVQSGRDAVA